VRSEQRPERFFVDESSFELPPGIAAADLEKHLEAFVSLIRARHNEGDDILRWSKLEETIIQPGILLCDLLYQESAEFPIDQDLRLALQQAINRCIHWDERFEPVSDPHVEINGANCDAPTVALVLSRVLAGVGSACITLGVSATRCQPCKVQAGNTHHMIHFLSAVAQFPEFFRMLFDFEDMNSDAYILNTADAFPELAFVPGLASQFSKFRTRYREVRSIVTTHLAALNDYFPALFKKHDGQPSKVSHELQATCDVDASPESPKTHSNQKAMKERDVVVDIVHVGHRILPVGRTVTCEWHTKISPLVDRIHFHPGLAGSKDRRPPAEGRVIIGIFAEHLSL